MSNSKIKIIPLGGVQEIGINCTAIEYNDEITVIDVGLGFPLSDQYGVDYVIPNIDYLKRNKDKIQGIIITHAHLDHIGALPYVIEDLGFPEIFASRFSIEVIRQKLEEHELMEKVNIRVVTKESKLASGSFEISFFGVTHSIPESMGVIIKTPAGTIVHTGDFKFDNSPMNEPVSEYDRIAKTGSEGVLALLSDSTNSFKSGHSSSERVIYETLKGIVENAEGRVIVATFSSLLTRLYQLITIAQETGRKVAVAGRSMENIIAVARKLNYIDVPDNLFVQDRNIKSLPDDKVLILATGAQGEHFAALARMARGDHKELDIKKGDTVILSASIIPGNDMLVQGLIDDLSEKGATVFHKAEIMDLHSSGHGYQEDQKLMINLVKPKFFIPVHGYPSFLHKHAQTAISVGVDPKHTIVAKRGDVIELDNDNWQIKKHVKANPVLVSGSGVGDIGEVVLSDREQLANYGVVVISASVDVAARRATDVQIISRGFVFVKTHQDLIDRIAETARKSIESDVKDHSSEREIRDRISRSVRKLLYDETEREPMILTVLNLFNRGSRKNSSKEKKSAQAS